MKFDTSKSAFGRHETFPLRYGWLSKGFHAAASDPKVFERDEATVVLGVGKNMVTSIRYWLRACRMIEPSSTEATKLGGLILDQNTGFDPYLEDDATIWLIHWLLSTNSELATAWFWFFNTFHSAEFTSQQLSTALADFVKEQVETRVSVGTVKSDAALITRMYVQSKGSTRTPIEEALDSPLASLNLVSQGVNSRNFVSRACARPGLPVEIFGYAVAELMAARNLRAIPIGELMYSQRGYAAPGAVFRLTESDLVTKLEQLVSLAPGDFELRETAGLHQLFAVSAPSALGYLRRYYSGPTRELAA